MQILICPSCGSEDAYLGYEKLIKTECHQCKHIFYYSSGKPIGKILLLFVKIKYWFKTNWSKVQTTIGDKIISERTIYISWCWNCKTSIKAVVSGTTLNKFIGNYLYGNKKCPKPECKHFICSFCAACLCDAPFYKKNENPISHHWLEVKSLEIGSTVKHKKYGIGSIKNITSNGDMKTATIIFENNNIKELILKFADLEIL